MTKLRIIKVNQTNLDIALENELWGRRTGGYKGWEKGSKSRDNHVVELLVMTFTEDDLYPNRIPIKKVKSWTVGKRIS